MGIAERRRALGFSQADVAKELGVDQTAVHSWEVGKTMPAAKRLPALAKLLNCTIDELLQEAESEKEEGTSDGQAEG